MSRVLSLLAAVLLVTGAMVLRDRLERRAQADTAALSVTCATELAAACERLEESGVTVQVEAAGDTVAALAGDQAEGPDLWLVLAPWHEIARARGATAQSDVSGVLARSPLVLAGFTERLDALEPACEGPVTWRCLGEQAGTPWRDLGLEEAGPAVVRPGHLDPSTSASGLLVAGSAVVSFAGRTDLDGADLDDEALAAWFARLQAAVPEFRPASGSQLTDMLTRGPASYDVVGTTEAEAALLLGDPGSRPQQVQVLRAEPVATADVVLVSFSGDVDEALDALGEPLDQGLMAAGWRVGPGPSLPDDAGLPDPGFLVQLQDRWREVAS
jgi:hypothetical protein